ncbi:MAG TPA: universal stress protein [Nitrospirae bacterium]|nr:universal stress protein/MSMEI_3859 [bacterium BMS3Abin06]HDH13274.1 universal stress protein [Nitrospirota bacterium]HDZ01758.1 universal stress protein [Nitrospirota bacterium]
MAIICPIPKILLPVDESKHSGRAVEFTGCLGGLMGDSLSGITLLHVMEGSYVGEHTDYVDFRAEILKKSDTIKKFKDQHIEKDIRPFMDEWEKILRDSGIRIKIEKLILDGEPAHEIVRIADEGGFSTIIMSRRGHSETIGITSAVVHAASRQTVYVIGYEVLKDKAFPVPSMLIPVDGSPYSMKGVEHAACLAGTLKGSIRGITLFRVINTALYKERVAKGEYPDMEAEQVLNAAKAVFLQAEVSEELITIKSRRGKPAEEILKEAEEGDYNLVIMGRKGRSTIKDLLLGGVSSTVLHRCQNPTVAIVSSG